MCLNGNSRGILGKQLYVIKLAALRAKWSMTVVSNLKLV